MKYIIYVLLLGLFSGCSMSSSNDPEWIELEKEKEISTLSDSLFLFNVQNIGERNDTLFLTCPELDKVVLLSIKSLTFLSDFGSGGSGPGDFSEPYSIFMDEDVVWIGDKGNQEIDAYYADGRYISSFKTPEPNSLYFGEFVKINNSFFFHTLSDDGPILTYNPEKMTSIYFGEFYGDGQDRRSRIFNNNRMNLHVSDDGNILTVNIQNGGVSVYTADGQKEKYIKLSTLHSQFEEYIERDRMVSGEVPHAYEMVRNSCYDKGDLYILVSSRVEKNVDKYSPNRVVRIDGSKGEVKNQYLLSGNVYSAILVKDNLLYAFNTTSNALEMYGLP